MYPLPSFNNDQKMPYRIARISTSFSPLPSDYYFEANDTLWFHHKFMNV